MSRGLGRVQRAIMAAAEAAVDPDTGHSDFITVDDVLLALGEAEEVAFKDGDSIYDHGVLVGSRPVARADREAIRRGMKTLADRGLVELGRERRAHVVGSGYSFGIAFRKVLAVRLVPWLAQRAIEARERAETLRNLTTRAETDAGIGKEFAPLYRSELDAATVEAVALETELNVDRCRRRSSPTLSCTQGQDGLAGVQESAR